MATSFTVNLADLTKILQQIQIAERHAAGEDLTAIIGPDAALLPAGLRTVDGSYNHLLPGQELAGAADLVFPRLLPPDFRLETDGDTYTIVRADVPGAPPGGVTVTNNNYDPTIPGSHSVADADPRIISNLIVDQSVNNPAAVDAWWANEKSQAAYAAAHDGNPPPDGYIPTNEDLGFILNASPDIGLSAGFNGWMTFFGQFFDHGLDLVTKGNNGTVYIPLQPDDPLYDKGLDGLVGVQPLFDANGDPVLDANGVQVQRNDDGYGADGLVGTVDDRPNFMALTRVTTFVDPVTGLKTESQNTTTPFIDQNQTYTSIASHQVFLREYAMVDIATDNVAGPVAVSTGRMLDGAIAGSIANWSEVKAQAEEKLGLKLSDFDVNDVPKLLTDPYGKFIAGANGFAQVYVSVAMVNTTTGAVVPLLGTYLMEGVAGGLDLSNLPLPADFAFSPVPPEGFEYKTTTVGTGHAYLNDIAHHAAPGTIDHDGTPATPKIAQTADLDLRDVDGDGRITQVDIDADDHDVNGDGAVDALDLIADDHVASTYDDEMLGAHFITGDGRGNENIGLTAVHTVFHAEHNRLAEANKDTLVASGDAVVVNQWLLATDTLGTRNAITQAELDAINAIVDPDAKAAAIDALNWDGERVFQAARFVTEMQYQHLVFEEFARKVQPNIDAFIFTNSADLDPAIVAEFAHVVYRFGHSMLTDTVDRLDNNLNVVGDADPNAPGAQQVGLIEAFLNPQAFTASGATTAEATGAIIRGMARQTGNEIDEFVVDAVRSNLVGLPLDLAALNIARGRDAGVPTFNDTRAQFYELTGDAQLKPYVSWFDFAANIKNPISIINFIAAYGKHESLLAATTVVEKRDAATLLVLGDGDDSDGIVIGGVTYTDRIAFLNGNGTNTDGTISWTAETSGLNDVDLWIGGLAEAKMEFGGMLGSTFNFVFETQLENLQNGDRFYYLSRTQGMNLLNQLEPNTFADLVMRNSDLGGLHATHLSGLLFDTPDAIIELDPLVAQQDYNGALAGKDPVWTDGRFHITPKVMRDDPNTATNEALTNNYLRFTGGEHVVLGGTESADRIYGDKGIDTLWGDGGDDYLNAGSEADQVFGGDGDDIIEDFFGDGDFLRGNKGNDVVNDTHGFGDVLFGDGGKDFIMAGSDVIEIFAGEDDDFLLGGNGADVLLGNEGNDWIEGGEGFDGIAGDNSELFFNSPIIGHDVLNGQGNDTDYDGESGDDIMFQGAGIQRNNGMLGFDWVVHKGDTVAANTDLGISRFINQQALTLRDRNDSVEAASGWKLDDSLIGTNSPNGAVGDPAGGIVGGPATDSMLLSQNVALISGFEEFLKLTPGALRGQTLGADATPFSDLPIDTTVFDPTLGGDILVGGAGSDTITGKAGNDLIDGDRWLNVRLEVHANKDGTGPLVTNLASVGADGSIDSLNEIKSDMLAGRINPGQLQIVRELITTGATAADTDIAVYAGARSDYTVVRNANGTYTVTDDVITPILITDPATGLPALDALLGDEGTDTLSNIEVIRFNNRDPITGAILSFEDVFIAPRPATGAPVIGDANGGTPTEGQPLTVDTSSIDDPNGLGVFEFQWEASSDNGVNWTAIAGANADSFTPTQAEVGQILRVAISFIDGIGTLESLTSVPTSGVGDLFNGDGNGNSPILTAFDDVANGNGGGDELNGLGGNDTLNGGAGADSLDGGAGNDTVNGDGGGDTLLASIGDGNDAYNGGGGVDTYDLSATTAGVTMTFVNAAGVTTVTSTSVETGVDTLVAVENFIGSQGNDTITINGGANNVDGQAGNDTINAGGGADTVDGGDGVDTLRGEAGSDTLNGGAGGDILIGGAGADSINTGSQNDNIVDAIQFLAANEYDDTISNFDATGTALQKDRIQLGGALNALFDDGTNNDTIAFVSGDGANGGNTAVNLNGVNEALFLTGLNGEGVTTNQLGSAALVAAEFNAEFNITAANGETTLLVINDTNGNSASVWQWTQAGGGEIAAAELTRIAVINANGQVSADAFGLF